MVTIAIIFIIGSFLASILVISAGVLSSRLGESEMVVEEYQTPTGRPANGKFNPWAQSAEMKA
jgi:hypothetical protein